MSFFVCKRFTFRPFLGLLLAFLLFSITAKAQDTVRLMEVFASVDYPVESKRHSVNVYPIDRISELQKALSHDLSANPEKAKQQVLKRFQTLGSTQSKALEKASLGLVKAMQYGIDRYPAIVFEGLAVVYGVTDLQAATQQYEQWRKGVQP